MYVIAYAVAKIMHRSYPETQDPRPSSSIDYQRPLSSTASTRRPWITHGYHWMFCTSRICVRTGPICDLCAVAVLPRQVVGREVIALITAMVNTS
jgi:hypothetical protein